MIPAAARVGALFLHDASGNHFCTASVVASPDRDLLVHRGALHQRRQPARGHP
jgi:hypothetical protein